MSRLRVSPQDGSCYIEVARISPLAVVLWRNGKHRPTQNNMTMYQNWETNFVRLSTCHLHQSETVRILNSMEFIHGKSNNQTRFDY
ncbi:MAG: hypothetical protein ACO3LA_04330 [Ilumatobacteraceae bacterium]